MASDLTVSVDIPSIDLTQWVKDTGLESVGVDKLFKGVTLDELAELNKDELTEYAKEIGLSVIQRKRFIKGINKLNGIYTQTPTTPNTITKIPIINPSTDDNVINDDDDDNNDNDEKEKQINLLKQKIEDAILQLDKNANSTKDIVRSTFNEFKQALIDRELKLIRDVDSTIIKKKRLLQTQLDYINDNGIQNGGTDIVTDINISLDIDKDEILKILVSAGWIIGASSDNKEEQRLYELERKKRELGHQQIITVEKLKEVTIFEKECGKKREESIKLQIDVKKDINLIKIRTEKCELELSKAKPLIEEAEKLVSGITKKQLTELKSMKKPPFVVELVMSSVVVILGNKIKSWKDVKKCVSDNKFIQNILKFDTNKLTKKIRKEINKKYINHRDFNEERANKASKVAGPLVKWVKSQIKYSNLLDIISPIKKEINSLKKKLIKKQKLSKQYINDVNELEFKISKCRKEIKEMVENMISAQEKYYINI